MTAKRRLPATNRPPPANQLLAALPPDVFARVAPALDVIPLKLKDFLHNAGEPIAHVYFPGGGFVSVVTVLKSGSMVEVATIGREGMLTIVDRERLESASCECYRTATDLLTHVTRRGN
jgi:hypothetical protein